MMALPHPTTGRTIVLGLSGSSSSGKTTLTALLSTTLPLEKLIMIHADDFCKEFDELPIYEGVLDADSVESVHFDRLEACLKYVLEYGALPTSYEIHDFILEDIRKASQRFSGNVVEQARKTVDDASIDWSNIERLVVVDGFLLFHNPALRSLMDIKLFLRTSKETAWVRRFGRYGAGATPEGSEEFWRTQSYFDKCVWRNYLKEHVFLFPDGRLESEVDTTRAFDDFGILTTSSVDVDVEDSMAWAVQVLAEQLHRISVPRS